MKKIYPVFYFLFIFYFPLYSQQLDDKEKKIIQYEAEMFIKEYQLLLNTIISSSLNRLEVEEIILNSYTQTGNRIFLNEEVIVEDDIDPSYFNASRVKDVKVSKYLNDLDLFYSKSNFPTIEFSEMLSSEVKQKAYIYVEVYFKSKFGGNHNTINNPYQDTERIATIVATKNLREDVWEMSIASIVFYNPKIHPHVAQRRIEKQKEEELKKNSLAISSESSIENNVNTITKPTKSEIPKPKVNTGLSKTPLTASMGVASLSLASAVYFKIKADSNYKNWEIAKAEGNEADKENYKSLTIKQDRFTAASTVVCASALVYYFLYKKKYKASQKKLTLNIYQPTLNTYGISIAKKF
ncbi:hypothetical protein [Chondrinema litorale]|uniref:hypothetical protein n=1 Tax=Chondrinema litorale TaxID=2994555 RepID=UPI0025434FC9|nr:hypothetical protein [Chondrinema litorale]UZR92603.1 hypothetical protein OQ292_12125 [Chondrinema litorale]